MLQTPVQFLRLASTRRTLAYRLLVATVVVGAVVAFGGCDEEPRDQTAARLAERVTRDQAEQNKRVAEAARHLTQGSQELVIAEGKARQEVIALQRDLRQDQAEVARQRDSLEHDRRQIASQRMVDSQLSSALLSTGLIIACLAPLVVAGIALSGLWRPTSPDDLTDVLVEHYSQDASLLPTTTSVTPIVSLSPPATKPRLVNRELYLADHDASTVSTPPHEDNAS